MQLLVTILLFFMGGIFFHAQPMSSTPEIFKIIDRTENFTSDLSDYLDTNKSNLTTILSQTYNDAQPLHYALKEQKFIFAKILVKYGADVNALDNQGNNSLLQAALALENYAGSTDIIDFLIKNGASTKIKNKNGETLENILTDLMQGYTSDTVKKLDNIFTAIDGNHEKQIKQMLLDYPERLNTKNESGDTPLLYALRHNNDLYALGFINSGADLQAIDNDGNTALHLAAQNGYTDCVKALLTQRGDLINQPNNMGDTPLIRAAASDKTEIVEMLISSGANLNHQGAHGLTALHWAAGKNKADIVEILVTQGADITISSNHGSPLELALKQNSVQAGKILEKRQEQINVKNDIFKAIDANDEDAISKLIQSNKKNLENRNADGDTPLLYCLKNKKSKLASKFIAVPVDINAQDKDGNTALHLAAQNGLTATIKKLLKNTTCNSNKKNNAGQTPLMLAAQQKNQHVPKHLIDGGAQLNEQDKNGKTALHYAVEKKNEALVKNLIQAGALVDIKDNNNKTPLEIAPNKSQIQNDLKAHKNKLELENNIFYAIYKEDGKRINELLNQDQNNLETTFNGDTPLLYSLKNNKAAIAAAFIQTTAANLLAADTNGNTALHLATQYGYDDVVQELLNKGINPNLQNNNNETPLHHAAEKGYQTIATMLIGKGAHINTQDNDGNTPLHWAAYYNQDAIIKLLAQQPGINLNLPNNGNVTAFMYAAGSNKPQAADALLQAGAAIDDAINASSFAPEIAQIITVYKKYNDIFDALDAKDTHRIQNLINKDKSNVEKRHFDDNDTPLLYCIKKNDNKYNEYAKNLIVAEEANITAYDQHGNAPLHCACGTGNSDIINTLLIKNAPIDQKNSYNQTPLIIAAFNNQTGAINTLLTKNPSINHKDNAGNTALHYAALKNNKAIITALLAQGADVYAKNHAGKTPHDLADSNEIQTILADHQTKIELDNNIFHAIDTNNIQRINQLLADPNNRESRSSELTPLQYSLNNGKPEIALICIKAGADCNTQGPQENAALHMACYFGFTNVVTELLDKGVNPNLKNNQKVTPLHFAAQQNRLDIVNIMIDRGADVNAQTINKTTPLHWAAEQNHAKMINLLIEKGATIDSKNTDGQTALHCAATHNKPEATQALIENGASLDIKDKNEKTPLELAQENSVTQKILKNNDIFDAISNTNYELINTLSKNTRYINRVQNDTKNTPLLYALTKAKPEIALMLIKCGANTNATNIMGYNALHLAAQRNYVDVAELLACNTALINAQNVFDGNTPLHLAIINYADINMASLLLAYDASFDIKNNINMTQLELAKNHNKIELIQLMESLELPLNRNLFKLKYKLTRLKGKLQVLRNTLSQLKAKLA